MKQSYRLMILILALLAVGYVAWHLQWSGLKSDSSADTAQAQSGGGHHGRRGGGGPAGPNALTPVSAAVAKTDDIEVTEQGLGTVTSIASVTVRAQISGQLMDVAFKEGQVVHKDDYLAQIDPRPYQAALEQAEGTLKKDQALLNEAKRNLERYRRLVREDSIARQQLDAQESLTQQYIGNIASDQAQVDSAKLNLSYCHITSPVLGRVGLRQVDQGNYVQTSDANGIVTITQLQPISVLFTLPEDDVPKLMKRLNENAELRAVAYDRTRSAKLAEGKLVSVDNQINVSTGTVKMRAEFDNLDSALFPNQFVNLSLLIDTLHDATVVPTSAIQRGTPETFVYRVKEDNTVTIVPVKLGPSQGEIVAILEGIKPGDTVVTSGSDKLRDGAKVQLPDAAPKSIDKEQKKNSQPPDSKDGAPPP